MHTAYSFDHKSFSNQSTLLIKTHNHKNKYSLQSWSLICHFNYTLFC